MEPSLLLRPRPSRPEPSVMEKSSVGTKASPSWPGIFPMLSLLPWPSCPSSPRPQHLSDPSRLQMVRETPHHVRFRCYHYFHPLTPLHLELAGTQISPKPTRFWLGNFWGPWHLVLSSSSSTQVWPKPAITSSTSWLPNPIFCRLSPISPGSSPRDSVFP